MSKLKERPNEKPRIGDKVILRHKNTEYYPARIVDLYRKSRWKIVAEIEWGNRGYRGRSFKKRCNYNDLTLVREDRWYEKLFKHLKPKKKEWLTPRKQRGLRFLK